MVSAGNNGPVAVAKMVYHAYVDEDRALMGSLVGAFGQHIMGTVFGAATMLSSIGMAFGPLAGGWIFDRFDAYSWLFIGSFTVGLGAVAVAVAFPPELREQLQTAR